MQIVDGWITTKDAAMTLQVTRGRIDQLVRKGSLHPIEPTERFVSRLFWLREVHALWEEPERRERRKRKWQKTGQWPVEALPETPPEGMRLLTCREAGEMLGVAADTIQAHIRNGRLRAYRGGKGTKVGRYLLPLDELERFRDSPVQRERLAAYERGRGTEPTAPLHGEAAEAAGEWLSTQGTANRLGITLASVGRLRRSGQLRGHRLRNGKQKAQGCYYRRENVEALLASADYRRRRDAWRRGNSLEARQSRRSALRLQFLDSVARALACHRSVMRQTPDATAGAGDPWGFAGR